MGRRRRELRRQEERRRQLLGAALLLIVLLAAGLRFWRLGELPPGLYHDEAYNGLDALALIRGDTFPQFYEGWELYAEDVYADRPPVETRFPVFFAGNYGREPLHIYLMALSVRLFGATPFAIRAVPAATGVLAVLTTFLAARTLLTGWPTFSGEGRIGRRDRPAVTPGMVALLAAFVLAFFYPALHFSRFGIRVMLFVPLETLAVWAFWRGVNDPAGRHAGWWYLLSGVFLGLGLYTYAAARLLPLLFVLFVPLWFWLEPAARSQWRRLLLMVGAALVTALPLLIFFARYPYYFIFRPAFVANKGLGTFEGRPWLTWLNNVGRVLRGLFWQGETHLRHNLPGRPYFDPIQAIYFLFGFVTAAQVARRPERLRPIFLWLWLVVMLLPSILSGDAPHFGRMAGAAAPAAILVALGVVWLWSRVANSGWRATAVRVVLGLALLFSAGLTIVDYYGRYAGHPELATDFYLGDWQLGQAAAAEPAGTALYLTPAQEELATIYFALGGDPTAIANYNGSQGVVPAGQPEQPAVYYLRPGEEEAFARLQEYFPDGEARATSFGVTEFRVPAAAPRLPGVNPTDIAFSNGRDTLALLDWAAELEAEALFVTLYWQAARPVSARYTAYLHLLDEDGRLAAQDDHEPAGYPTLDWRPGEIVADLFTVNTTALPAGAYTLQTGFYDTETQEPLGDAVQLGRVTITNSSE